MSKFVAYVSGVVKNADSRIADNEDGDTTFIMSEQEFQEKFPGREMTWDTLRNLSRREGKVDILPVISKPVGWR